MTAPDIATLLENPPATMTVQHDLDTLTLEFLQRLPGRSLGLMAAMVIGAPAALCLSGASGSPAVAWGVGIVGTIALLLAWRKTAPAVERLRISPHSFQLRDGSELLWEDILRIELCPPAGSRWIRIHTRDRILDVVGGLKEDEAIWLGSVLEGRVRLR